MLQFLEFYNLVGIFIALCTFFIIGIFHPLVIKAEYYLGVKSWWLFLLGGIVGTALSIYSDNLLWSICFGVYGASSFWGILEVFQQRERVRKGWFPKNPKRK
jgi:branched-subunit amino acid transport protein